MSATGLLCNRLCGRLSIGQLAVGSRLPLQHAPARLCALRCNARADANSQARAARPSLRTGRRRVVVCQAAAKNFYDLLGVSQSASDRDIKSAYRKLAMKLHPDVNKAPDAQKRFMEVKVAYETLSDAKQRAEYDRRLRMGGGFSGAGARAGGGFGGASTGGSTGSWGSYGSYGSYGSSGGGPSYTQEPVPGLDELIRELEKEFTAWANQRSKGSKEKSLLEELEDLGGELLDFLEESLGIKDEQPAGSSSSSASASSGPRDTRSAAERFDAYWRQYGEGAAGAASAGGAAGGSSSGSSSSSRGSGTASSGARSSGAGAGASSSSYSSAAGSSPRQAPPPPPPPKKSTDEDIEAELLALKKKLNKL